SGTSPSVALPSRGGCWSSRCTQGLDVQQLDDEQVAGFRAAYSDRTGERVGAGEIEIEITVVVLIAELIVVVAGGLQYHFVPGVAFEQRRNVRMESVVP